MTSGMERRGLVWGEMSHVLPGLTPEASGWGWGDGRVGGYGEAAGNASQWEDWGGLVGSGEPSGLQHRAGGPWRERKL